MLTAPSNARLLFWLLEFLRSASHQAFSPWSRKVGHCFLFLPLFQRLQHRARQFLARRLSRVLLCPCHPPLAPRVLACPRPSNSRSSCPRVLLRFRQRLLAKFSPGSSSIWGICFPRTFRRRNQSRKSTSAVNWSSHLRRRNIVERSMTWSEAFSIFTLILTSYFPHRWKDLTCYKLLILQTHRHFSGRVWRSYDIAFRQHAAATKLVDWSSRNSELFNFHAAGAALRPGASGASPDVPEPSGAPSSQIICRSWNRGRCSSQYNYCRYAHRCSICAGPHRSSECSVRKESVPRDDRKRPSPPPPASASSSKARRH